MPLHGHAIKGVLRKRASKRDDWFKVRHVDYVDELPSDDHLSKDYLCLITERPQATKQSGTSDLVLEVPNHGVSVFWDGIFTGGWEIQERLTKMD